MHRTQSKRRIRRETDIHGTDDDFGFLEDTLERGDCLGNIIEPNLLSRSNALDRTFEHPSSVILERKPKRTAKKRNALEVLVIRDGGIHRGCRTFSPSKT